MEQEKFRYFLYSFTQYKMRLDVEKKLGKVYVPGKVLVNGKWKPYTEISTKPSNNKFADSKVVSSGNLSDMSYIPGSSEWRSR